MKTRVPVIVKDPEVSQYKGLPFWEPFTIEEDFFLDGPISRRVAVVDFDEAGNLAAGTPWRPASDGEAAGSYEFQRRPDDPGSFQDWGFLRAAVFGGVYKCLSMFEEADTLGRRVRWAFPGPQLLVVPRAGEWGNAFYERDSRSLQLFFVSPPGRPRIYTCHSQDIIGHETAHAVIDGVAPDLYDAVTPESLALHEGLADLATVLLAFRSRQLAPRVLEHTGGSIAHSSAFTRVAEQFGNYVSAGRHDFLRDLQNDLRLGSADVDPTEPHSLSQVLSGALYAVAVRLFDSIKNAPPAAAPAKLVASGEVARLNRQVAAGTLPAEYAGPPAGMSAGKALFLASERIKRMALRALDYLPPGDVTFADYGRAVWSSDQASHQESDAQRDWLAAEFVRRGIVAEAAELQRETGFTYRAVTDLDLDDLVGSDWTAYGFVNAQRRWLGIPPDVSFEIRPRLRVAKRYYHRGGEVTVAEVILKAGWTEVEPMAAGHGLPARRRVRRGVTLAIDAATKEVRALLRTEPEPRQRAVRDEFVRSLVGQGVLRFGGQALAPNGAPLRSVIPGDVTDGALRIRAAARLLHFTEAY